MGSTYAHGKGTAKVIQDDPGAGIASVIHGCDGMCSGGVAGRLKLVMAMAMTGFGRKRWSVSSQEYDGGCSRKFRSTPCSQPLSASALPSWAECGLVRNHLEVIIEGGAVGQSHLKGHMMSV